MFGASLKLSEPKSVTNGSAAVGVLAMVLFCQQSSVPHSMMVRLDKEEGNVIQLIKPFLNVETPKNEKYCSGVPNLEFKSSLKPLFV